MIKTLVSVLSVTTVGALLPAQAPPAPAKELAKLEPLLGTWTGKGKVTMVPGVPASDWTATTTYKKTLGGHFIREDMTVQLGPDAPGDLKMSTFHGWDRENERYVAVGISNMGKAALTEIHWDGADTMISVESGVEQGQFVLDRWTTRLGKDSYEVHGLRSAGGGDFFTHVQGTFKRMRGDGGNAAAAGDTAGSVAEASFVPLAPEHERFQKMAGTYKIKGWFVMPGLPKTNFTGTEKIKPIMGGTILGMHVTGDPIEGWPGTYEGYAALAWDPHKKRYQQVYLNNMGGIGHSEGWAIDKSTMVFLMSGLEQGTPGAGRLIVKLAADGAVTSSAAHGVHGTSEPVQSFAATYTRQ